MTKEFVCPSCNKHRTDDDKIVMKICYGCCVEMFALKIKKEGENDNKQ